MAIYFSGRTFTRSDILEIQAIVRDFPKLSRNTLAEVVCESLGWCRPNGSYKKRECYEFLNMLEENGIKKLPSIRKTKPSDARTVIPRMEAGSPKPEVTGDAKDCASIEITRISSPAWHVACHDRWIGWDDGTRKRNLNYIVNNSRFLILP